MRADPRLATAAGALVGLGVAALADWWTVTWGDGMTGGGSAGLSGSLGTGGLAAILPGVVLAAMHAQIDRLAPQQREQVQKAVALVGSALIGKFITRELVLRAAQAVGLRLSAQQAAKYVPLAGQAASAALGYATLRYLGEQHLRDCVRVVQAAGLALPAPPCT